jgi:hypothetical protein
MAGRDRPKARFPVLTMRLSSDLAALHQGINSALSLTLLEAVLGCELSHKIVVALERGQILLGELASLRSDVLEHDLPHPGVRGWCI